MNDYSAVAETAGKIAATELFREGARRLVNDGFSVTPGEKEMERELGESAADRDKETYSKGHASGWGKGLIIGVLAVSVGFVILGKLGVFKR